MDAPPASLSVMQNADRLFPSSWGRVPVMLPWRMRRRTANPTGRDALFLSLDSRATDTVTSQKLFSFAVAFRSHPMHADDAGPGPQQRLCIDRMTPTTHKHPPWNMKKKGPLENLAT